MAERRNEQAAQPPAGGGGGFVGGAARAGAHLMGRGASFLSNTASTALGVGLGTSLTGLPMAALDTYMNLSKVLTQVHARFRESTSAATAFGQAMGYGMAESAQLAETLGKVSDSLGTGAAGRRYLGFARAMGADPHQSLTALGRLGSMSGRDLTNEDLRGIAGSAKAGGMSQGRLDEYLQRLESATQENFRRTGEMDPGTARTLMTMPSVFFGVGTPGAAENQSLMGGLNEMLSGNTGDTMRTHMMRAIGFGSDPSMTFRAAQLRLEKGISDPENLRDLMATPDLAKIKNDPDALFKALFPYKGSMTSNDLSKLTEQIGTGTDPYKAAEQLNATMGDLEDTPQDFNKKTNVSAGEAFQNVKEDRLYSAGAALARSVDELEGTIDNMVKFARNFMGGDIGGAIERAMKAVEKLSAWAEETSRGPGDRLGKNIAAAGDIIDAAGWEKGGALVAGSFLKVIGSGMADAFTLGLAAKVRPQIEDAAFASGIPQQMWNGPTEAQLAQQREALSGMSLGVPNEPAGGGR